MAYATTPSSKLTDRVLGRIEAHLQPWNPHKLQARVDSYHAPKGIFWIQPREGDPLPVRLSCSDDGTTYSLDLELWKLRGICPDYRKLVRRLNNSLNSGIRTRKRRKGKPVFFKYEELPEGKHDGKTCLAVVETPIPLNAESIDQKVRVVYARTVEVAEAMVSAVNGVRRSASR